MQTARPQSANIDTEGLQAEIHRYSLRFRHAAIESEYRAEMQAQTTPVVRFGIALAIFMYLLFGLLDLWITPATVPQAWLVRLGVLALAVPLLAFSFAPAFLRYRETLMAAFMLVLGLGLLGIFAVVDDRVVDQYYVGFVLIIIGSYTVLGLQFPNATLVSLLLIAMYLASEWMFRDQIGLRTVNNATFLFATIVIAGVGGYIAERQRRLAYFRRRLLEHARAESQHDALHDPLTGLANRRLMIERLDQAIARARRNRTSVALMFVDLDSFKPFNDRYGHVFGDRLLKAIAMRLVDQVRLTDTVARLGGDEFVVLLEDLADLDIADEMQERILQRFADTFEIDGRSVTMGLSIGAAAYPRDGELPRQLLEAADKAMYRMKQKKRSAPGPTSGS